MPVCPVCGKDEMFHLCPKLDSSIDKSFDALDSASSTSEAQPGESAPLPARFGRIPPLVVTIIVLNVAMFLLLLVTGVLNSTGGLVLFGALYRPLVADGEYWRLLTSEFLHGGILHIVFNMYCLWALGRLLEPLYGTARFGLVYLVSAIAASLLSLAAHEVVAVGASGAIFGIAGAMAVAGWRYDYEIPTSLTKAFGTGALPFLFYNLVYGFDPSRHIDNAAHIGGALAGAACALMIRPTYEERPWVRRTTVAGFVALVALVFCVHVGSLMKVAINVAEAEELRKEGKLEEARLECEAVVRDHPHSAFALVAVSQLEIRAGQDQDAENHLRTAIRFAGDSAAVHRMLGLVLADEGKVDDAIAVLHEAVRLEPDDADAHSALGIALHEKGDAEGSLAELQKAQQLQPEKFMAPVRLFAGHTNRVWVLRFSRDSQWLSSGSLDETVKVWKVASGNLKSTLPHRGNAFPVDFSPDGKRLATASEAPHSFRVWTIGDQQGTQSTPPLPDVRPLAFSPDWHYLASYGEKGKVQIWDFMRRRVLHQLSAGESPFQGVAKFSPDGRMFAAPGADNVARVWDTGTGKELYSVSGDPAAAEEGIVALFFSPDGNTLTVVDSHKNVRTCDAKTGRELKTTPVDLGGINIVEYVGLSPDGKWLAAETVDGLAMLTDLQTGRSLTLPGHRHGANAVAFSPDGCWLVTASWMGELKLWKVPAAAPSCGFAPR